MAVEKIVNLKVQDDFGKTDNAVKSLRAQLREATANVALMSEKFGATSKEAIEAAKRAAELKDMMGDAQLATEAFNPDAKFKALGNALQGVAGGFAAYQGMLGVAGIENKELEKQILKVQSAMAITQGLDAIGESIDAFKILGGKLKETAAAQAVLSAATAVQTFVTGAATTAMKAFRIALVSTGIGALVVGVGLLIANFEKISGWVSNLVEKFGGWRNVLMILSPPIWAIVKALEAMGVIESEAEEKSRKAAEAKAARNKKEAIELEKRKKQIGDYYDFEIAKAEASGKDTFELEKKKRDAIIATARALNERMRATIQDGTATEAEIKRWNENQALITKLQQENVTAELKREKEKNDKLAEQQKEANQKAKEKRDKKAADDKAARDAELSELNKALKDAGDLSLKIQLGQQQFEEKQVNEKYDKLIALAKKYGKDTNLLEDQRLNELNDISLKYTNEQNAKLKDLNDALKKAAEERRNLGKSERELEEQAVNEHYAKLISLAERNGKDTEDLVIAQMNAINNIRLKGQQQSADDEVKIKQATEEAKQAIEEKSFEIAERGISLLKTIFEKNKAIQKALLIAESAMGIAKIVINTRAANAAVRLRNAAIPPPLGPSLTATEIVLNNVSAGLGIAANIAATSKALSALGGGGASGGGGGSDTGGSAPAAPQFNIVGQNPNNQLAATIAGQQGQPIRAYVVGQEVTTQQSLDRQIRNTATFNS